MSVHFTIPWAQGMESIPSGGGYIPSYPDTYPGMEHPREGEATSQHHHTEGPSNALLNQIMATRQGS